MADDELSGRQRLELALLEEDVGAAERRDDRSHDAAMGALVRYLCDEGITKAHIYHPRETHTFTYSRMAVVLANSSPNEFAYVCHDRSILIAAGIIDPNTPPLPDPDDDTPEP